MLRYYCAPARQDVGRTEYVGETMVAICRITTGDTLSQGEVGDQCQIVPLAVLQAEQHGVVFVPAARNPRANPPPLGEDAPLLKGQNRILTLWQVGGVQV